MTPYFNLNQDKYPPVDPTELYLNSVTEEDFDYYFPVGNVSNVDVRGNHSTLIRELGAAGTVLLKNVGGALPLKKPKNIAVFGNDAGDIVDGMYSLGTPFDQVYGFGKSLTCSDAYAPLSMVCPDALQSMVPFLSVVEVALVG